MRKTKSVAHRTQGRLWEEEHMHPYILLPMDSTDISSGVELFWQWLKQRKGVDPTKLRGMQMACGKGRNVIGLAQRGMTMTVFFGTHDPTTMHRQGGDVGIQYRSTILTTSEEQKAEAETFIRELDAAHVFHSPIVTSVEPLTAFYPAEDYHREYYKKNPDQAYCQAVINPKLAKFRERYAELVKHS